jgi:Protein of unknown function (DUF1499)
MLYYSVKTSCILLVVVLGFVQQATAYQQQQQTTTPENARRAFIAQTMGSSAAAAGVATCWTLIPANAANAMEACPKGSSNCIRTTWTAPAGTSRAKMAQTLTAVLESYPQEGQDKVDQGGWSFITNDLSSAPGTASLEYKSGIGNFAKFLNGGKPFIDDLKLQIVPDSNSVEVRSSSRVGESDLNVNQKRLTYLVKALKAQGWEAPDPKY